MGGPKVPSEVSPVGDVGFRKTSQSPNSLGPLRLETKELGNE